MATNPTSALDVQNWFETTLSAPVASTDTTINLNAVPTPTEGYLILDPDSTSLREVIHYTSTASGSVSLPGVGDRGIDGTTAQSHAQNATVRMEFTTSHFDALKNLYSVPPGTVTATLLSISPAVVTYTVTGLGGTAYYLNEGGLKHYWGITANQSTQAGNAAYALITPPSFFTKIESVQATAMNLTNVTSQYASIIAATVATIQVNLTATANSSSAGISFDVWGA